MKTHKLLVGLLCAVALVVVSVAGTLAYLIDTTEEVVNTFTVGNVQIKLDEADVDEDGKKISEDRVLGNEYHLIPGQTYIKDPTMTVVKGSEESYVRLIVTINKIAELKAIFGNDFLPGDYVAGWDETKWVCVKITENGDNTADYEFRYYKTVDASEATEDVVLEPLFTQFTLPGDKVNGEQLATLATGDGLQITAVGHAIQRSMLETADKAWEAFDAQMNPNP